MSEPLGVLDKAFAILGAFSTESPSLSLTQICGRTGLSLATASRLLKDLVRLQALNRDATSKLYTIDVHLTDIAHLAVPELTVRQAASLFLDEIAATTRREIQLLALDGAKALVLDRREGREGLKTYYHVGDSIPLVSTSAGQCLLALAATPDTVEEVITDRANQWPLRDSQPPSSEEIKAGLAAIRRNGYASLAFSHGSVGSVAAPVRQRNGAVVAALGIIFDLSKASPDSLVPVVKMAALGISRRLNNPLLERQIPDWGQR